MDSLMQDLRHATRMLCKNPSFTIVVVLTLALGIGANTAVFSVIEAVLLRSLPFSDSDELVMIWETDPSRGNMESVTSYPSAADWREQNRTFEHIATFNPQNHTITGIDKPERISGARVSADFFPLLRVNPILGRAFSVEDDKVGAENVVMLSHGFWERHFSGDRDVIGRTLSLDGMDFTVVGVLPDYLDFPFRINDADVWTPTALEESFMSARPMRMVCAVGRLKPGVTQAQAQADMESIIAGLAEQYPDLYTEIGIRLVPLLEQVVGDIRPAMLLVFGAVGLVLLVACVNIANLLLARGAGRKAEFAVRAAMGAPRGRLIRQLLTESLLLSLLGGGAGMLLGYWGLDALIALLPEDVPRAANIAIDGGVLGYVALVTLAACLIFGLLPAFSGSRVDLNASLKGGDRNPASPGRNRLGSGLIVLETALALMLLTGAGLLTRSFQNLVEIDSGFNPDNMLTFYMDAGFSKPMDTAVRSAMYSEIVERMEALPGVDRAAAGTSLPLWESRVILGVVIAERELPNVKDIPTARHCAVTPDFFQVMGIPLLRGREFTEHDQVGAPGVMVINETMARRVFPDEDPIGHSIRAGLGFSEDEPQYFEIVGIVADARDSIANESQSYMYVPSMQQTWPFLNFALRTKMDPKSVVEAVREEVAAVTTEEAAFNFFTMDERFAQTTARQRLLMTLLGVFAGTALLLSAVGIYGMLSYSVVRRTHEIGIRAALGAGARDVLLLIMKHVLLLTLIGALIGLAAAFVAARSFTSLLHGVAAGDPLVFCGVPLILLIVASAAAYIPARRATRIDPMTALRCE